MLGRIFSLLLGLAVVVAFYPPIAWPQEPQGQAATPREDPGWPREFERDGARVVVYQPQLDGWEDYRKLQGRMAVAVKPSEGAEPVFGAMRVETETQADLDHRTVYIYNLSIVEIRFPSVGGDAEGELQTLVAELIPKGPIRISLDRLLAGVERGRIATREIDVSLEPPPIFVSKEPGVLVIIDGAPLLVEIEGTGL